MVLVIYISVILSQLFLDGFTSIVSNFAPILLGGFSNLHFCYFVLDSA